MKHNTVKGQINIGFREYSVNCSECPQCFVDYFDRQSHFVLSAKEAGWRKRNGQWYCPGHAAQHRVQPTSDRTGNAQGKKSEAVTRG
jgi:hypothetical protein